VPATTGVLLPGGTPILVTAYPRAHCSRALASLRLAWACEQLLAATQRAISAPQALGLAANAAVALINFSQSSEEQISVPGVHDTSTGHASVGQQQGAEAHTSDRHHPTQSSTAPTHDSTTATTTTRTAQGSTVIADSLSGEYMVVLHDLPPGQPLSSLLGVVRPSEGHPLSCPDNPRSMDWGAVLTIALHVCSALHGLHAKGLAHGDVRAPYIWAYRGPLPQAQRSSQPMQASLAAAGGSQAYPRESHSTFSRGDTGSMAAMLQPSTIHTATTGTSTAFTSATLRGYASMADSRASAVFERFSGIIGGQPSSDSNAMGGSSVTFQLASLLGASGEISMAPPRVLMPRPNRPSFGAAPGVTSAGSTTSVVLATLLWSPLCGWVRPAREQALASAHLTSHFAALQSGRQQAGGTGTSVSTLPSSSAPVTAAGGAHVAPELHSGGLATPAGDVYALGILLWSLVNCEHAYDGESGQGGAGGCCCCCAWYSQQEC
jgi:serine/threonine protein kinase